MRPLLVIDLDGTLLDVARRHYAAYCSSIVDLGLSPLDFTTYWAYRREGKPNSEILVQQGVPENIVSQAQLRWLHLIESPGYLELDTIVPGAHDWLRHALRCCDLVLCTVRSHPETVSSQLDRLKLRSLFQEIYVVNHSEKIGFRKAAPFLSCGKSVRWWIGDTEDDFWAAKLCGAEPILVSCGQRSEKFLKRLGAPIVVKSLSDVVLTYD